MTTPQPSNEADDLERKRQKWLKEYEDAVDLSNAHQEQLKEDSAAGSDNSDEE